MNFIVGKVKSYGAYPTKRGTELPFVELDCAGDDDKIRTIRANLADNCVKFEVGALVFVSCLVDRYPNGTDRHGEVRYATGYKFARMYDPISTFKQRLTLLGAPEKEKAKA